MRYTANELQAKVRAGESQTDWRAVAGKTAAEIEHDIAADPDAQFPDPWPGQTVLVVAAASDAIHVDPALLDWFRAQGPDWPTKIDAALRAYRDHASTPGAA